MTYLNIKRQASGRVIYIDRDGDVIHEAKWRQLRADPNYRQIAHYINDDYEVLALWMGQCNTNDRIYKPYSLVIFMRLQGERVMMGEMHESNGVFADLKELQDAYQDFLVRHCGCEFLKSAANPNEYHFIEKGNQLAPPPKASTGPDGFQIAKMSVEDAATIGDW